MHKNKYIHLTPINIAKYKQHCYNMLNDINIQNSEYEKQFANLNNGIISIENAICEIDIQLKIINNKYSNIEVEIYSNDYKMDKFAKREILEGKDSLLYSKRHKLLIDRINFLKNKKEELKQKKELLLEKKKLLKDKKKVLKKEINIVSTNIESCKINADSILKTIHRIDEASINGVEYLSSKKIKPKIKEMKKRINN